VSRDPPIHLPGEQVPAQAHYAVIDRWGKCVSWEKLAKGQTFPPLSSATHEHGYVVMDVSAWGRLR